MGGVTVPWRSASVASARLHAVSVEGEDPLARAGGPETEQRAAADLAVLPCPCIVGVIRDAEPRRRRPRRTPPSARNSAIHGTRQEISPCGPEQWAGRSATRAYPLRRKESWVRAGSWLSLFGTADSPGGGVGAWNCWCGGEAPLRGRCGLASGVGVQRFARDVGVVGPTQPIPAACSARASPKPVGPSLEGHPRRPRQRGAELDDLTRLARQPERTHLPPTRCPSPRRSPSGRARPTHQAKGVPQTAASARLGILSVAKVRRR